MFEKKYDRPKVSLIGSDIKAMNQKSKSKSKTSDNNKLKKTLINEKKKVTFIEVESN